MGSGDDVTSERGPSEDGPPALEASLGVGAERQVGRYKLLQVIGEGGFGVVYMAEQTSPVRRRVAVKLIKAGMDTKLVVARFEAERQALALMDHPNIAHVLDGGATESGRPYFVMELVNGVPITQYADANRLTPAERLELFVPVCRAVQHAHTKGVIHRDLKPSNVLVTLHDGRPVPKVIDFGVAKATQGRLTDRTLFTEFRQMVGTPQYMSPEQAEMSGLDVDTRSDVYSLGVVLYELLTGTVPFAREELLARGEAEMQRILRETDPPRPSTRVTSAAVSQQMTQRCRVEPAKLGRMLASELDWVVMKCLEKDRTRRYDTAGGLADDIDRYLRDEGVQATPPSAGYRARRFVRRYRTQVAVTGVVVASLAGGLVATGVAWREAAKQRDAAVRAEAEQARLRGEAEAARAHAETQRANAEDAARRARTVTRFLTDVMQSASPTQTGRRDVTVAEAVESARALIERGGLRDQPLLEADLRLALVRVLRGTGKDDDAYRQARAALEIRERLAGPSHPSTAEAVALVGECLMGFEQWEASAVQYRRAVEVFRAAGDDFGLADALGNLSYVLTKVESPDIGEIAQLRQEATAAQARVAERSRQGEVFRESPQAIRWTRMEAEALSRLTEKRWADALLVLDALIAELEAGLAVPGLKAAGVGEGEPFGLLARLDAAIINRALALENTGSPRASAAQDQRLEMARKYYKDPKKVAGRAFGVATVHRARGRDARAVAAMRAYWDEIGRMPADPDVAPERTAVIAWRTGDDEAAGRGFAALVSGQIREGKPASSKALSGLIGAVLLRGASGEHDAAIALAREVWKRAELRANPASIEFTARLLVAGPKATSEDAERARALLGSLPPDGGGVDEWRRVHTTMLADLRVGRYAEAVTVSRRLVEEMKVIFEPRTTALACRAMALARSGDLAGARSAAKEAEDEAKLEMDEYRRLHPETPMADWLLALSLLREMRETVK